jgi:hypothetical protein
MSHELPSHQTQEDDAYNHQPVRPSAPDDSPHDSWPVHRCKRLYLYDLLSTMILLIFLTQMLLIL